MLEIKKTQQLAAGLYVVATPIGNLGDFSLRAQQTLQQCQRILCEDTRETTKLLRHYQIRNQLASYHKFNESKKCQAIVEQLQNGAAIALVSDSGTPAISDPGNRLVCACHDNAIPVFTVPGCCSIIAAASASGMAESGFSFIGFLPAKTTARIALLTNYQLSHLALVCCEVQHRILTALEDIETVFGSDKRICIARELTKKFEVIHIDSIAAMKEKLSNDPQQCRGEMVMVIAGNKDKNTNETKESMLLLATLQEYGLGVNQASQITSKVTGVSKKKCYQRFLEMSQANSKSKKPIQ